ncbi:hypothetical protein [Leptospira kirschneri]|nr:hypothetical protein [Leptospira kirschneri]EMJ93821.1 hypothetical protein LEP1GSC198_2381 [Leptospira kirschneri str. JB]EMK03612.1 hypothetical protein LEP1GSC166_2393 [Leptospira kirschneri]
MNTSLSGGYQLDFDLFFPEFRGCFLSLMIIYERIMRKISYV